MRMFFKIVAQGLLKSSISQVMAWHSALCSLSGVLAFHTTLRKCDNLVVHRYKTLHYSQPPTVMATTQSVQCFGKKKTGMLRVPTLLPGMC